MKKIVKLCIFVSILVVGANAVNINDKKIIPSNKTYNSNQSQKQEVKIINQKPNDININITIQNKENKPTKVNCVTNCANNCTFDVDGDDVDFY